MSTSSVAFINQQIGTDPLNKQFTDTEIGEALKSINADEILLIAKKMTDILSQSLKIDENARIQKGFIEDEYSGLYTGVAYGSAKGEFMGKAAGLFEISMQNDFQFGRFSQIYKGSVENLGNESWYHFDFTPQTILSYAEGTGSPGLGKIIGDQLPSDYRINLTLDMHQTKKQSRLVFRLREIVGHEIKSTTSFTSK